MYFSNVFLNVLIYFDYRHEVKQDMQCTYNVTMEGVSANIVSVEKQYVLHIVSVCL